MSPDHAIGCLRCSLAVIDVASGEGPCHDSQWTILNIYSMIFGRRSMVFHPRDMSCPAKLYFEKHVLYAGNHSHFKDLDVGDQVIPMYG